VLEVGGLNFELYLHFGEQGFQSKTWRRGADALIQFANLIHGNQFPGESRQASKKWRRGQYSSPCVPADGQFRHR
jgi:hypothetical protein